MGDLYKGDPDDVKVYNLNEDGSVGEERRNVFDSFETHKNLPTGDRRNDPPILSIWNENNRVLLEIRAVDGKLTAQYNPEDLDEATRAFVDEVLKTQKEMGGG